LLILAWAAPLAHAASLAGLIDDSLLHQSVHRRLTLDRVADDGAVGVNRERSSRWYIEEQRAGADFVQSGVALARPEWADIGWRMLDWGIARQSSDGGFAGTGDPFHSTSFFVEALARALLLDPAGANATRVNALRGAADWLVQPDVAARAEARSRPYAHRRWLLAAALAMAARATGDARFIADARAYAADGLRMQMADGANPEKGGADVGYQMVGVVMASRYVAAEPEPALRQPVVAMIERAARWEALRIRPDGSVIVAGSTRMQIETARDGRVKGIPARSLIEGFVYAARLTGDASLRENAQRIARHRGWLAGTLPARAPAP
jgi:hypothetical protein